MIIQLENERNRWIMNNNSENEEIYVLHVTEKKAKQHVNER